MATHQVQQPRVVAAIVLLRLGASALDRLDGRHVERPIARQFSHVIEDKKRSSHDLVTSGIYSIVRHPSYAGFYWFAVFCCEICILRICFVLTNAIKLG